MMPAWLMQSIVALIGSEVVTWQLNYLSMLGTATENKHTSTVTA